MTGSLSIAPELFPPNNPFLAPFHFHVLFSLSEGLKVLACKYCFSLSKVLPLYVCIVSFSYLQLWPFSWNATFSMRSSLTILSKLGTLFFTLCFITLLCLISFRLLIVFIAAFLKFFICFHQILTPIKPELLLIFFIVIYWAPQQYLANYCWMLMCLK